jgi:predicted dithiol-disulfide oxidoreductase (DUF899 family)
MALTFPGESAEYRAARNRLLDREIQLRRLAEEVARERRALPPGGMVPEDYVFHGDGPVRLSELFNPGSDTLVIYSYMFGPQKKACPMCTPMLDGLDGVNDHLQQRLSFAVVAESSPERLRAWVHQRGWTLRLLSSAGSDYNRDYHGVTNDEDSSMLNVFQRKNGHVRHFWGTELAFGPSDPGQDHRGLDLINPIFEMFDFTPEGRGDWYTKAAYELKAG